MIPIPQLRRLWFGAQSLPAAESTPEDAVGNAGYVRTLGGADVYLALRARVKDVTRARIDAAVERGDLRVVPTVRGCIYLVPREEVPWSLRIADLLSTRRRIREYEKAGIRNGELEDVGAAVLEALGAGPAATHELRKQLAGVARSLGDPGKKVGISSTLPPALRELEFQGKIERALEGGRLDTERYLWRLVAEDPFDALVDDGPTAVHDHFAALYFSAAGVGSADRFAQWAGIGKRDARAATERLGVTALPVDGPFDAQGHMGSRSELIESEGVALLPFEDNLVHLHDGVGALVDPNHHDIPVPSWGRGRGKTLGTAAHMAYRFVALDGAVVGFWEFDPDGADVVLGLFAEVSARDRERIRAEASDVARFLREDVGNAVSFSLDTEDDLRRRSAEIQALAR